MARFEEALAHAEDRAAERHPLYQQVLRSNIEAELQTRTLPSIYRSP
jgi:hypothetical protein